MVSSLALTNRSTEDVDAVSLRNGHDGPLRRCTSTPPTPGANTLAFTILRVDCRHPHTEHLLDRNLDLGLVGVRVDEEGVLVLVEQSITLF